jgi:phosphoglycerate dehydrogenase-like enzyme
MTDRTPAVLVPRFLLDEHRQDVEAAAGGRATLIPDDEADLVEQGLDTLEAIMTGIDAGVFEHAIEGPAVRWVHSISAGVEHLPLERMAERGILLTNSAGAYATAMAEYTLAGMIMLARNLPFWLDGQREHRWRHDDSVQSNVLRGKRLGIVGYGAVGRELAAAARALGMEVWATKRTPLFLSGEPLDRLLSPDDLAELLAASDFVVLCASLNRTTAT